MGCVYHPNHATVAYCDHCRADLCEHCALRLTDRRILCHRCIVALSVEDVRIDEARRRRRHEAQRLGLTAKWRPTYIQAIITLAAVLALLMLALQLYWDQSVPHRRIILDQDNPLSLLDSVQTALEHYAAANQGIYPQRLYDLLPRFLTDTDHNRRLLRHLNYKLDQRYGYLLRIKETAPFAGKELEVTAKGIRLPQGEASP